MLTENGYDRTSWLRFWRINFLTRKCQCGLDTLVLMCAFVLAYLLRFDFDIPQRDTQHMLYQLPFVLLLQLLILWRAGIYAFIWRYVGMAEVKAFLTAGLLAALPMILMRTWLPDKLQPARIPLSITIMDVVFAFGGVLAMRILRRAIYERGSKRQQSNGATAKRIREKISAINWCGSGRRDGGPGNWTPRRYGPGRERIYR
jgi:FlaA1/EpsC-like NDP-sugar epimerase